ncbi:hypothetical protein [Thalassobaculum litoreum]|uniref:Uncharacterized protein n=1 Tax=Thalassobaculum litoreum DSM 18839 TaxID=1123362 RepID=A0A8G2BGS8_9PROT|nr:hypothetical protein [Thalassobaculum litoreum]SDF62179.1 hypothetical protein SAMN05660686_01808 [Thalassobaculum litoreum DSM 18839]
MTSAAVDGTVPAGRPRHLVGASLISAAGSLPTHLLPVTITAVVAGTSASPETAGLIASAMLIGQLASSIGLPLLKVTAISRLWAGAISLALLAGLVLSGSDGFFALLGGWFAVGLCCGTLLFLGTVSAAHFATPSLAFTLRLGVVLVLAGASTGLIQISGAAGSYDTYLVWFGISIAAVLAVGNLLYAPIPPVEHTTDAAAAGGFTAKMAAGLVAAYVLFVGQTGLVAYVLFSAVERGMDLSSAAWAFAACKVGSGLWLVSASRIARPGSSVFRMSVLGVLVAVGGFGMSKAAEIQYLFGFLILFQIAFNSLSAQMQGSIAATGAKVTGRWIAGTLLLGAASGPPLHGWAIGAGLEAEFVIFAVATALLPVVWRVLCRIDRPGKG